MNEIDSNSPEENITAGMSTGKLLILSLISANVYVFFSFLIIRFWHKGSPADLFNSEFSIWLQLGVGAGTGIIAAAIVYFIIGRSPVSDILSDFTVFNALSKANFSLFDNTQLSVFAGAGEELLFRGAIQPLLGNTFTSIIFIGIHGYFKFKSPGHILFGVMMFGLSFTLGLLFEHVGLIAAMIAHSVYDLIMLQVIQKDK